MNNKQKKLELTDEELKLVEKTKFDDFVGFFLDKSDSLTYGNATQSACLAYHFDPKNPKDYAKASVYGHRNVKNVKELASAYADSRGHTLGKMMDVAVAKMYDAKNGKGIEWWKEIMILTGMREPEGAKIVINNSNNQANVDINDPAAIDYNKKFKQFLMNE